jgi:4'-phosphopantetheinyl transferase
MDFWLTPPENPKIQPGEVHLWRAGLDIPSDSDWALLSPEEQQRANRFRFDLHRARFVRAHAITRLILASYMEIPAHQLQMGANRSGKPFLIHPAPFDLRFNLSHSGGLMLLGVTDGLEIGVDIELHAESLDWRQIATNYFSPREIGMIESPASDPARRAEFYRLWTLKEAYLKANGQGLAGNLDQVEIQSGPEDELSFGGENEKHRWQVFVFKPASGASGAVVVEKLQTAVRLLQYDWTQPITPPD